MMLKKKKTINSNKENDKEGHLSSSFFNKFFFFLCKPLKDVHGSSRSWPHRWAWQRAHRVHRHAFCQPLCFCIPTRRLPVTSFPHSTQSVACQLTPFVYLFIRSLKSRNILPRQFSLQVLFFAPLSWFTWFLSTNIKYILRSHLLWQINDGYR